MNFFVERFIFLNVNEFSLNVNDFFLNVNEFSLNVNVFSLNVNDFVFVEFCYIWATIYDQSERSGNPPYCIMLAKCLIL